MHIISPPYFGVKALANRGICGSRDDRSAYRACVMIYLVSGHGHGVLRIYQPCMYTKHSVILQSFILHNEPSRTLETVFTCDDDISLFYTYSQKSITLCDQPSLCLYQPGPGPRGLNARAMHGTPLYLTSSSFEQLQEFSIT